MNELIFSSMKAPIGLPLHGASGSLLYNDGLIPSADIRSWINNNFGGFIGYIQGSVGSCNTVAYGISSNPCNAWVWPDFTGLATGTNPQDGSAILTVNRNVATVRYKFTCTGYTSGGKSSSGDNITWDIFVPTTYTRDVLRSFTITPTPANGYVSSSSVIDGGVFTVTEVFDFDAGTLTVSSLQ